MTPADHRVLTTVLLATLGCTLGCTGALRHHWWLVPIGLAIGLVAVVRAARELR